MHQKLLYVILISLVLGGLVGLANTAQAGGASLSFNPASGDKTVNQTFDVAISLDTGGASTDGTRAIINYDPNKLELLDIKNGVYNSYPTKKWENGQITISGISALDGPYYSGSGTFATLTFKASAAGSTDLSFVYTASSTTDSNVAEHGTNNDILSSVQGANFNIQNASSNNTNDTSDSSTTQTTSSNSNTSSSTGNQSAVGGPADSTQDLPNAGAGEEFTFVLVLLGVLFLMSGGFLLRQTY